jgi:cytochrome c553
MKASLCSSSAHHNTGRRVTTTSRGANNRNSCRRRGVPSSRADADAPRTDDEDKNERGKLETKKDSSRRAFVACSGCAFCFAASFSEAARAFPKLVDLNEETVEDVNYMLDHRNQRADKVFAKASKCLCFSSFFLRPP